MESVSITISSVHVAVMFVIGQDSPRCWRTGAVFCLAGILILYLAHFGRRVTILPRQHDGLGVRVSILAIVIMADRRVPGACRLPISGE
jgi:hypothetical protein